MKTNLEKLQTKIGVDRWFTFLVLVLGAGTIFKLNSLKDIFYVPMQQYMGLNHSQIGMALSIYGLVQTIGLMFSVYLADRFSKKYMISFSLLGVGITGLYLSTFPTYRGFLISFVILSIFGAVIYWPVLLKSVRLIANENEQGRVFGFLETGRGIVDTTVAFSALAIFSYMGSNETGLRYSILFFSVLVILIGVVSYFLIPHDNINGVQETKCISEKNRIAFKGMVKAVKMKEIWAAAFTIFSAYSVYCGVTYFIPFLSNIYKMPSNLVGIYGIINQYGLKMVGGPIGGFLVDRVIKSSSKYIRIALIVAACFMSLIIVMPHESMSIYTGMAFTLSFGAIIFTIRAVFFATMDEIKVPIEISGAAMSIGSMVGYSPAIFAYTLYGTILDKFPGILGYKLVFGLMILFCILGVMISSYLIKIIKNQDNQKF